MAKKTAIVITGIIMVAAIIFLVYKVSNRSNIAKVVGEVEADERALLSNKAEKLMSEGEDDAAIKKLELLAAKHPDSPESKKALLKLASIYEKRRDLLKAREIYKAVIEKFPDANDVQSIQESLDGVNIKILFSSTPTDDSFFYQVQKGDTLSKIARKFSTTTDLIVKANNLKSASVALGSKLKIVRSKFSIAVDKSQNILTLKADGNIIKTYRVATGKDFSTPVGTFKIVNKIENPTWYTAGAAVPAGSPKNILGTRWLGISEPHYGIHGTTEPESIGKQTTAGCVRMKNPDVEELYAIVPVGTEVVIVD